MGDNKLQQRRSSPIKEKGQYFLAFGVIASMLLVANFPVFVIFFFGVFAFFLLKMFASGTRNETREIFEFYLSANEMLRDDGRKWFGFEIKETILRGEAIVQRMNGAPPLVYFALGALYNKAGDHQAAVNCLTHAIESENADESTYVYQSVELRNYVKVLRKIERDPADAPLTSAAVRSLERSRKLRGNVLLGESRKKFAESSIKELRNHTEASNGDRVSNGDQVELQPLSVVPTSEFEQRPVSFVRQSRTSGLAKSLRRSKEQKRSSKEDAYSNRKPITEVLHDIYDKNVQ